MGKPAGASIRPLARSLYPLTGESIGGYLLRLAHRLCLSPVELARWIGCGCAPLSRRLLFDLDTATFAAATRLSSNEAAALTLGPWADRYPPVARALTLRTAQAEWLVNTMPRYARSVWPGTAALSSSSTAAPGSCPGTCRSASPAPTIRCSSATTVPRGIRRTHPRA